VDKEVTLELRLNAKAAHLPVGTHDKPEALLIEGGEKRKHRCALGTAQPPGTGNRERTSYRDPLQIC
jgi:hypothetical protein